jgi:hypothetical protein
VVDAEAAEPARRGQGSGYRGPGAYNDNLPAGPLPLQFRTPDPDPGPRR